jgi:superkiller protein 3
MRTIFQKVILIFSMLLPFSAWPVALSSLQKNEPSNSAAVSLYEQGIVAMEKKQFDAAEKFFIDANLKAPRLAKPILGLAEVARMKKQDAEAEKLVRKAFAVEPNNPDSQLAMGRLLYTKKNYLEAETAFLKSFALAPNNIAPQLDLAELYLNGMNKPGKAVVAFRTVVKLKPDHAGAYFGLGNAQFTLKNYPEALQNLNKASSLAPENPLPLIAISQIYAAKANNKDAITALQSAAMLAPKMADIPLKLGMIYQQNSQYPEAFRAYESAIQLDDKSALAYNNLAWLTTEIKGRFDEGIRWANKAIELVPQEIGFKDTLAWVMRARGDADAALGLLQSLAKNSNATAEIYYHLGLVSFETGRKADALAAFKRALQLDKDFYRAEEIKIKIKGLQ